MILRPKLLHCLVCPHQAIYNHSSRTTLTLTTWTRTARWPSKATKRQVVVVVPHLSCTKSHCPNSVDSFCIVMLNSIRLDFICTSMTTNSIWANCSTRTSSWPTCSIWMRWTTRANRYSCLAWTCTHAKRAIWLSNTNSKFSQVSTKTDRSSQSNRATRSISMWHSPLTQ